MIVLVKKIIFYPNQICLWAKLLYILIILIISIVVAAGEGFHDHLGPKKGGRWPCQRVAAGEG